MSDFFIGQIMMTGFGFAQKHFAQCNGQMMAVAQNQALFALLGITYGGDGRVTFALPDLRSRTPAGGVASADPGWQPEPYVPGQAAGSENITLLPTQLPMHNHLVTVTSDNGTRAAPRGNGLTLASTVPAAMTFYGPPDVAIPLSGGPLESTGGNQPHPNQQPYSTINFNIALAGIYPSRG